VIGWPLHVIDDPSGVVELLGRAAYGTLLLAFVAANVGVQRFMNLFSAAVVTALTTALLGAGIRKTGAEFVRVLDLASGRTGDVSIAMLTLFVIITVTVPYSIFALQSFSARALVESVSRRGGRGHGLALHAALVLRVAQHVGEVGANLKAVWTEENPQPLLPRHRTTWEGLLGSGTNWLAWARDAALAWAFALLVHSLAAVPMLVDELQRMKTAASEPH
jgi:hypothetical protein